MQTFLPYESFDETARVLDPRRLGKQRVEVLQILRALCFEDYGWRSHPAVCMWRGHEQALVAYGVAMTEEWLRRGHHDSCRAQIVELAEAAPSSADRGAPPRWLGMPELHRSHQSALVRKDSAYYRRFFPDVPDDLPYVWPEPCASREIVSAPVAAWVLRAPSRSALTYFTKKHVVALPALASGGRSGTKAARQLAAFREEAGVGDVVVVPHGARLLAGELTSEHRLETRNTLPHVRDARWLGEIDPQALARPALLQDPRVFFALRGDDDVRAIIAPSRP